MLCAYFHKENEAFFISDKLNYLFLIILFGDCCCRYVMDRKDTEGDENHEQFYSGYFISGPDNRRTMSIKKVSK